MDEFRKYKPMVYVCSPYSGDTQFNTAQAKKYSRFAYEQGAIPMTPHLLYPQFMCDENPAERSDAMHFIMCFLAIARNFGCSAAECPMAWHTKSVSQRRES
jgi:hypothetical protein